MSEVIVEDLLFVAKQLLFLCLQPVANFFWLRLSISGCERSGVRPQYLHYPPGVIK